MKNKLDNGFKNTPFEFGTRIERTLNNLPEEKNPYRLKLRAALLATIIALLSIATVYALVSYGQKWYLENRFTAIKEHMPEKYNEIMDSLKEINSQEIKGEAANLVDFRMQDYAWAKNSQSFTLSFAATVKDDDKYELHAMQEMDVDGEDRNEHWLWSNKGYGPVNEQMTDSKKQLILLGIMESGAGIYIGDSNVELPLSSYDVFTNSNKQVLCFVDVDLNMLNEAYIKSLFVQKFTAKPEKIAGAYLELNVNDKGEQVEYLQNALSETGHYNGSINGIYDNETALCLKNYQEAKKLSPTGVADNISQELLYADYEKLPKQKQENQDEQIINQNNLLNNAKEINSAIDKYTDEQGNLKLRIPYTIYAYNNGEYENRIYAEVTFTINIK